MIIRKIIPKKSVIRLNRIKLLLKKPLYSKTIKQQKNISFIKVKSNNKPREVSNIKLSLVIFHSEGPPYDNAKKINNLGPLYKVAKKHVNNIATYTPRILKSLGYGDYVKEYSHRGVVSHNSGINMIGFCAWRPLIMLLELEKLKDDEILVYRDCNIHKYKKLLDYNNFKNVCSQLLKDCKFDIFIGRENNTLKLKHHCKTNIIRDFGNHKFLYEFPLLLSGFIIARKSKTSIAILKEWLKYCEKDEYINGEVYGPMNKDFRWSTPEQSILGVIIAKLIKKRKYNIPLNYPKYCISARNFKIRPATNYDYLKYINE